MDLHLADRRPTVFVVDDDAAVRRALAFALDLEGFEVETFESGEAPFPEFVGFILHGMNGMIVIPVLALLLLVSSFFA